MRNQSRHSATVRVRRMAHTIPGALRIEVSCPRGTTGMAHIPTPVLALTKPMLITSAVYAHEERCGHCSTDAAHAQGDQRIRDFTDRAYAEYHDHPMRSYAASRRN
jgi:hypothetical protein